MASGIDLNTADVDAFAARFGGELTPGDADYDHVRALHNA